MLSNNTFGYSLKIISEMIKEVIYFPAWWYGPGFFSMMQKSVNFLDTQQKSLGLLVWIKNIHRPMYGQYDWQGRLISFFMRLVQIIFRSFIMLIWFFVAMTAIALWAVFPPFVIYQIIFQLGII